MLSLMSRITISLYIMYFNERLQIRARTNLKKTKRVRAQRMKTTVEEIIAACFGLTAILFLIAEFFVEKRQKTAPVYETYDS